MPVANGDYGVDTYVDGPLPPIGPLQESVALV
jgi:hypothetical protein